MIATAPSAPPADLQSPETQRRINALRSLDNLTNWLYLAREYLVLGLTLGLTLAFYHYRADWGLSWFWNVPVSLVAIVIVGACQHRLATLGHEASHYMLFRSRLLNELASDWFCMFPMLSTTHAYRLQHLAHHQYVNDPERDPDISQMAASGHRFRFPMSRPGFLWNCVIKQLLWLPSLIRYILVRARYTAAGSGSGPYQAKGPSSRLLIRVGVVYLVMLVAVLAVLSRLGNPWLLVTVPAFMLALITAFYALVPERLYSRSLLKSDVPPRWTMCLRVTHVTLVFFTVSCLTYLTGKPWGLYYGVLWIVPLVTSYSLYMILRQVVQHGNAGRERLTNTRIFHVNRLIQLAVFPLGMDYHLPHHLFPMVPHYRLRQLHALLMETDAYRREATLVEGYFLPRHVPPTNPTVLDLMARAER